MSLFLCKKKKNLNVTAEKKRLELYKEKLKQSSGKMHIFSLAAILSLNNKIEVNYGQRNAFDKF